MPPKNASPIFICHRKDDCDDAAESVRSRLLEKFGAEAVLPDLSSIPLGEDIRDYVRRSIAKSRVGLIIIGPNWLDLPGKAGRPRIRESADQVRVEIEAMLENAGMVKIPVYVNGASPLPVEFLPPALQPLAFKQGAVIGAETHFQEGLEAIESAIRRILENPAVPHGDESAKAALPAAQNPAAILRQPEVDSPTVSEASAPARSGPALLTIGIGLVLTALAAASAGVLTGMIRNPFAAERPAMPAPTAPPRQAISIEAGRGEEKVSPALAPATAPAAQNAAATWDASDPWYSAAYTALRFAPKDGSADVVEAPLSARGAQLRAGGYVITLIGKSGFAADRSVDDHFEAVAGEAGAVRLPPAVPRTLAGCTAYTGFELPCEAYGERAALGTPVNVRLDYWTQSILVFDSAYQSARLIDENSLFGPSGFQMLDAVMLGIGRLDQKASPGTPFKSLRGYVANLPYLQKAFDALRPPDFATSTAAGLRNRRGVLLDVVDRVWRSIDQHGFVGPRRFIEIGPGGHSSDFSVNHELFTALRGCVETPAWSRIAATALDATRPLDGRDVASIESVNVGGRKLLGAYVEQPVSVKSIDSDGKVTVLVTLSLVDLYNLGRPILREASFVLSPGEKTGTLRLNGKLDAASRTTTFSPAAVTNSAANP